MSAAPPPVDTSCLHTRVHSKYDYTNADAVINILSTTITCPIVQEVSSAMLIFNNQCYVTHSFYQYLKNEKRRNDQFMNSGYRSDLVKLKDPQTNEEFSFDFTVSNMVHRRISYRDLKELYFPEYRG